MACRVCLAVGIDDPEAWINQASPRTLALWEAFFRIEPWGFDCERTAGTNAIISNLISLVAATSGQKIAPLDVSAFMPSTWDGNQKPRTKKRSTASIQKMIARFPTADKR